MSDKRLIDPNALGGYISDWQMSLPGDNRPDWNNAAYDTLEDVLEAIKNAPTIDPETLRPVAHWVNEEDYNGDAVIWTCSRCKDSSVMYEGTPKENGMKFCPYCGAKMEE